MSNYVVAPPAGNTTNSVGAADRHWGKGYFDELPGYNEYLVESTGYGIVSGCTPSITGLTVSVAAGVVHLPDGTRKELSASTVTLDAADTTNPRIDLVYIDSTGTVAKITGTAAATPSAPALPSGGISVATVSVAANATAGTVADDRKFAWQAEDKVYFHIPRNTLFNWRGDCEIVETQNNIFMIDTGNSSEKNAILGYIRHHGFKKIDYVLLSHYHGDHYGNIQNFLAEPEFANTKWLIPPNHDISAIATGGQSYTDCTTVIGWLNSANADYTILSGDITISLSDTCYVDLMCSSADFLSYMDSHSPVNYNDYSVYALVRHGNVNALFTGDGWGAEADYVYDTYDLPHVNLLKAIHHGEYVHDIEKHYQFIKKLSPDYYVFNQSYGYQGYGADGDFAIVEAFGGKCIRNTYNSVFLSDKDNLINISENSDYNFSGDGIKDVVLYVDASATDVPDGTQAHPFKYIKDALRAVPTNSNIKLSLILADGTYDSITLHGRKFVLIQGNNITIPKIEIYSCTQVYFNVTTLNCNLLNCKSNGTVRLNGYTTNITSLNENDCLISYETNVICHGTVKIYGSTANKTGNGLQVNTGMFHAWTIKFYNLENAILLNYASFFSCVHMNCENISKMVESNALEPWGFKIFDYQTMTNVDTRFTDWQSLRIASLSVPETRNKRGTTANRPLGLSHGQTYFDTTIGHLLIFDGANWFDTTNGNNV